jgi:hypothetical protein
VARDGKILKGIMSRQIDIEVLDVGHHWFLDLLADDLNVTAQEKGSRTVGEHRATLRARAGHDGDKERR